MSLMRGDVRLSSSTFSGFRSPARSSTLSAQTTVSDVASERTVNDVGARQRRQRAQQLQRQNQVERATATAAAAAGMAAENADLGDKGAREAQGDAAELVLLDQLVEIDREQLKDQTERTTIANQGGNADRRAKTTARTRGDCERQSSR